MYIRDRVDVERTESNCGTGRYQDHHDMAAKPRVYAGNEAHGDSNQKTPANAPAQTGVVPTTAAGQHFDCGGRLIRQPYSMRRYLAHDERHEAIALARESTLESVTDIDDAGLVRMFEFLHRNGKQRFGR